MYCLERAQAEVEAKLELARAEPLRTVPCGNRESMAKLTMKDHGLDRRMLLETPARVVRPSAGTWRGCPGRIQNTWGARYSPKASRSTPKISPIVA